MIKINTWAQTFGANKWLHIAKYWWGFLMNHSIVCAQFFNRTNENMYFPSFCWHSTTKMNLRDLFGPINFPWRLRFAVSGGDAKWNEHFIKTNIYEWFFIIHFMHENFEMWPVGLYGTRILRKKGVRTIDSCPNVPVPLCAQIFSIDWKINSDRRPSHRWSAHCTLYNIVCNSFSLSLINTYVESLKKIP